MNEFTRTRHPTPMQPGTTASTSRSTSTSRVWSSARTWSRPSRATRSCRPSCLEYLLGQYAASDDEATIQAGIDTVRTILAEHYVHRNEAELVKSTIKERGRHKIIDKVTVTLNDKDDVYEAEFANLGIKERPRRVAPRQGPPQAAGRRCVVHLRHRVLPHRRPARRAMDPRLAQADPDVQLRLRRAIWTRAVSSPPTSGSTC